MDESETAGAKLRRQKGNSPDHQLRSYKLRLSGKGCRRAKTIRRLAQKQPSLKECVTAHWSSVPAPKMSRGSSLTPKLWNPDIFSGLVGERSASSEAGLERPVEWAEVRMPV